MKFIIFSKAKVQNFPCILSLVSAVQKLGYTVVIITQNIDLELKDKFEKQKINIYSLNNRLYKSKLLKLFHWYQFAKFAKKQYINADNTAKIWITGADTAICLGLKTLHKRQFYFQINELYDKYPFYLKQLNKIAQVAYRIIVPEKNRAAIFQVWFNLTERPFVLPNKPFFDDELIMNGLKICKEHILFLKKEKQKGKIILLYQGHLGNDRDFSSFLREINNNKNILLVLMGQDHGVLDSYKRICPSLYYISPIIAPYHLIITQLADVGILIYLHSSLNNLYCAPNKIWEYSKYGLAIIGNDVIGLDCIINQQIGIQLNLDDESDIENKLDELLLNMNKYKLNSLRFYDSIDFESIVKKIIENE